MEKFHCSRFFSRSLPPPRQVVARQMKKATKAVVANPSTVDEKKIAGPPPYGKRQGWLPRTVEDYGDGGAFPEIHVAQYPLDMGRKGKSSNSMSLVLDKDGKVEYDAVVKGGSNKYTKSKDLVPIGRIQKVDFTRPDEEEEAKTETRTKLALDKLLSSKSGLNVPTAEDAKQRQAGQFISYTPTTQDGPGQTRVVKMVSRQEDPLEPAKHKHKRVPRGPPSPPPTVMHSPTKKVTKEDQEAWKIPPAVSNWKNPNGYTIPLDKRLAADGRGLQDNTVNNRFAHFAEALYLAGEHAREEVARRAEIRKEALLAEREAKERSLQELARQTREAKERIVHDYIREEAENSESGEEREAGRKERDEIRDERRRDRERKRRIEAAGGKRMRDEDRDVSERIALGERVPMSKDAMFDQRLFNQSEGMQSGFGADDEYNVYDKPLFNQGSTAALFKAPSGAEQGESYVSESEMNKIMDTSRFKPDRDFSGVDRTSSASRNEPVQFEKGAAMGAPPQPEPEQQQDDGGDLLSGLDDFLASAKKKRK